MTDIRHTQVTSCEIVTVKSEDPHVYRPYQVYAVTNGVCGHRTHFTKAAALQHHTTLVNAETKTSSKQN